MSSRRILRKAWPEITSSGLSQDRLDFKLLTQSVCSMKAEKIIIIINRQEMSNVIVLHFGNPKFSKLNKTVFLKPDLALKVRMSQTLLLQH